MDPFTEILAPEELAEITGYKQRASQIAWLKRWGWKYVTTATGEPKVGRVHARQMLGDPTGKDSTPDWETVEFEPRPDVSKVNSRPAPSRPHLPVRPKPLKSDKS